MINKIVKNTPPSDPSVRNMIYYQVEEDRTAAEEKLVIGIEEARKAYFEPVHKSSLLFDKKLKPIDSKYIDFQHD